MALPALRAARTFDPSGYVPLTLPGHGRIGWLQPPFAAALSAFPLAFAVLPSEVSIRSESALNAATEALAAAGWIRGWRNERYEIAGTGLTLERASFRRFGLMARAVHLNGWVREGSRKRLWVAQRSTTKPVDPGLLDNLVGGGIGARYGIEETLLKECGEEAGMPSALAGEAQPASRYRVCRPVEDGVHDELIHVYDLELPPAFVPENRDGEVAGFELVEPAEVVRRLSEDRYTVDAGVATADFLWRHGHLRDPAVGDALAALAATGDAR